MKRFIGAGIAALLLATTFGTASSADAHTTSSNTWAVCNWWKGYFFPGTSVFTYAAIEVHWWNRHQVVCHYEPIGWVLLYDRGSGAWAWIH